MNCKTTKNSSGLPRVAMYIWHYSPIGGTERQCEKLSKELADKGVGLFIVTERTRNGKSFEIVNGISVYRVNSLVWLRSLSQYVKNLSCSAMHGGNNSSSRSNSKNRFQVFKFITNILTYRLPNYSFFVSTLWLLYKKRNEFDILHIHGAHWVAGFGVRIAHLLNKKAVVKESGCGESSTFLMQSFKSRKGTTKADLFIAVSNKAMYSLITLGIPNEKIRVIPNGVEDSHRRWQVNLSKERPAICTSHIAQQPLKGLDILLEAWGILIHKYHEKNNLRIFGLGDSYSLSRLSARLGIGDYVHFLGFADDIMNKLLSSYLFVLPSRVEGLSNSLLEAMALGVPCVATDISGNQDLIQHGINGLLVPAENPEILAKAMLFMLNNPDKAAEMGQNAAKTIEKGYKISTIADRYIEVYKELDGGHFDGRYTGRVSCENMH